jgi:hypothetical protein
MNDQTRTDRGPRRRGRDRGPQRPGGGGGPRRAGALAVVAAVTVLTASCSFVHVHTGSSGSSASTGSASTGSATFRADLAYAQCMQTHGVPNFPDPSSSEGFSISGQSQNQGTSPVDRANEACQHLLPRGSVTTGNGSVTQAQLDQALKVVQCLRAHGEPAVPDPTVLNGSLHLALQPSDLHSAQFQAAVNACQSLIPKGVKFP